MYPNAVDGFAGYNISLIAIELPITAVTVRWQRAHQFDAAADAKIAGWASTLRQQVTVRPSPADPLYFGDYVQVDRVGNPLTVEALIPLPMKDYWNRSAPADDAQFAQYIGNPFFATGILNGVFGLPVPPAPAQRPAGYFCSGHHPHRPDHRSDAAGGSRIAWAHWAATTPVGPSADAGLTTT